MQENENKWSLSGLYYRYKKTSDADIQKYLKRIKLVQLRNMGVGTIHGYYPLNEESLAKIIEKPRNISLTFDATEPTTEPLKGLAILRTIVFLVKSSSRFFLKPDIGEVFDQIHSRDLWDDNKIKAIRVNLDKHETLDDTDGEHFLMEADLLCDEEYLKKIR